MIAHTNLSAEELRALIKAGVINYGGNQKLKIFGMLNCRSGKRMLKKNRIFFTSAHEAKHFGYRPCGHCMKHDYKTWKQHYGLI